MELQPKRPDRGETTERIKKHLAIAKNEAEKRKICLTWSGYIAALLEWGLIWDEYDEVLSLLKPYLNADDPTQVIFLGTENQDEELQFTKCTK